MQKAVVGDVIIFEELYWHNDKMEYHLLCENSEMVITFTDIKIVGSVVNLID